MKKLVSVLESYLQKHPEYAHLTILGEEVLGRRVRETFYIGRGDDSRLYYFSPSHEVPELVGKLSEPLSEIDIRIQDATEANMPKNLADGYKNLLRSFGVKV